MTQLACALAGALVAGTFGEWHGYLRGKKQTALRIGRAVERLSQGRWRP